MNPKPGLLVMAAGIGSRYGGLKQIDPVGPHGEAVLDYSVFDACRAGFGKVVFVIRRDIEKDFRDVLGRRFENRMDVRYVFQSLDALLPAGFQIPADRQKPWGTGHALLCATSELSEPFAAINADDFYGADSFRVVGRFLASETAAARDHLYSMVGFKLSSTLSEHGTVARGICRTDADDFLTSVEELTAIEKMPGGARHQEAEGKYRSLTGNEMVSMNFWGFTPAVFAQAKPPFAQFLENARGNPKAEFYIPSMVNALIQQKQARVKVLPTTASWFGVTYREDRPLVIENIRALVRLGAYPEKLWA